MIIPPPNTTCYYTARFQSQDAIQVVLNDVMDADASNFDMALVVSIDLTSDIEATNSMCSGVQKIEKQLVATDSKTVFNPLYLPVSNKQLFETIEMDDSGKVLSVGDFTDPFVTCNVQVYSEEGDLAVMGKVAYNEFHVHHPIDPTKPSNVPYLS